METEIINKNGNRFSLRWARESDVSVIRRIVNQAYKELADMGLNYTATFQDEDETRTRMAKGRTLVIEEGDVVVGTILMFEENKISARRSAYLGQFGILPSHKKLGLGSRVMDFMEDLARSEGYECIQLDTAKPAEHLVQLYLKRGYKIVSDTRFEGKTYESWIFEKDL